MLPGLQIAGLFLAIGAALAFTTWAETWLASAAPSVNEHVSNAKLPVARELANLSDEDEGIRAA